MSHSRQDNEVRVALAGLGTVGGGTLTLLQDNADLIARRCGRPVKIVAVSAKGRARARAFNLCGIDFEEDTLNLANRPDVDVVCELIGGASGIAFDLCKAALKNGKHVVTANKAMLATHGMALSKLAEEKNVALMFEAAVGGGIPIIKTMREALAGNSFTRVQGILNGTCNYILTQMSRDGADFETALKEAQHLGYAEANPSADVDGHDSAHKLCLLASLAFGIKPDLEKISIEGIRNLAAVDFSYAKELGYSIKMLGFAKRHEKGIELRVSPCLVRYGSAMAAVDDVMNAVQVYGDACGPVALVGQGAGSKATASAVVSDLIDLARGHKVNMWGLPVASLAAARTLPPEECVSRWFIRIQVTDQAGVLADIAGILRDQAISIESLLQRGRETAKSVPVIIVTHEANEATLRAALAKIAKLDTVWEEPFCLRMDTHKD